MKITSWGNVNILLFAWLLFHLTGTPVLARSPSKGPRQGYLAYLHQERLQNMRRQCITSLWAFPGCWLDGLPKTSQVRLTGTSPFTILFTVCRVWWHNSSWKLHRHKPPLCCKIHYPRSKMNQHVPSAAARTDQHCLPLPKCQMNFFCSIWHQQPHKSPSLRVVAVLFMLCSPSYS